MIGFLRGAVLHCSPDAVLIDVGGVGYRVHVPLTTYYEIEKVDTGTQIELYVHTHVREDALALFGFWSDIEKQLFEKLIAISGIGPKLAQTILSGMPPTELAQALAGADFPRLYAIPGVGKKTAERMVLELKDKVSDLSLPSSAARIAPSADEDVVAALLNLGYRRVAAERALGRARADDGDLPFADLLRKTLSHLSRT